jgi:hypothetical protein
LCSIGGLSDSLVQAVDDLVGESGGGIDHSIDSDHHVSLIIDLGSDDANLISTGLDGGRVARGRGV